MRDERKTKKQLIEELEDLRRVSGLGGTAAEERTLQLARQAACECVRAEALHEHNVVRDLTVADTGVGIPAEDLPHIFEEFHQVERTVGPKREGTGLGLAIAQRSAQLLGGHIDAVSEVGKGSSFTLHVGTCPVSASGEG